jgi:hypothetical protein
MKKCVPADVFVGDEQIGTAEITYDSAAFWKPGHTHLFCPICGKVWGKVLVKAIYPVRHSTTNHVCREHGGGLFIRETPYIDRFGIEWSEGVYKHDFCLMYDYWLEGMVEPAVFRDGSDMVSEGTFLSIGSKKTGDL